MQSISMLNKRSTREGMSGGELSRKCPGRNVQREMF